MRKNVVLMVFALFVLAAPMGYGDVLLDHLNDPGMATWYGITGADMAAWAFDADTSAGAGTSAKLTYTGNTAWWGALQGEYATPYNLTNETHVRFWAKATGTAEVRITLHLITGSWGAGSSIADISPIGPSWARYEVPIADFRVDSWYNSSAGTNTVTLNWANLGTFQYQVFSNNAATVWLDHIYTVRVGGPAISNVVPARGLTLANTDVSTIGVTFSKSVTGVNANNLKVAGSSATNVTGSGAGPYVFSGYAHPSDGLVNVVLSSGTIVAGAEPFAGDRWSYTLVPRRATTAYFVATPPVIDGILGSGEWPASSSQRFYSWLGTIDSPADFSATFNVVHDANFIYVAVTVTDDDIGSATVPQNWWQDDAVEIFVDDNHSQNLGSVDQTVGHIGQVGVNWNVTAHGGANSLTGPGPTDQWNAVPSLPSPTNYVIEFFIRKSAAGLPTSGTTVGFNVQLQDRDSSVPQQARLWWFGAIDPDPWDNEYGWGNLILSSEAPPISLGVQRMKWSLYE